MAEDFNCPEDILNEWVKAGKKEDASFDFEVAIPMDITVYLRNMGTETFENARLTDIGSRVIVQEGNRISVYPEDSVLMYEAEPSAVEDDEE